MSAFLGGPDVADGFTDRRLNRHGAMWTILAAAVLSSVAFLGSPGVFDGLDWLQMHLPYRVHAARTLLAGELPTWNPYVGLGRPFLADLETAVLYPPNLLFLAMDPTLALAAVVTLHVALALAGTLAFGRALGASLWASACAGLGFSLGAPLATRLASGGQVGYFEGACYVPLLFFLAARVQDQASTRAVAQLALGLGGQFLCGHPQIAWVTWIGIGAFLLGRGLPAGRAIGRGLLGFAAALVLGLGITAPVLLPFAELVTQGNRAASLALASGAAMEWWQWTSLLIDDGGRRTFYWEFNLYAGTIAALAGLAGLADWRERNGRGLAATALAGALVGAGPHTPAFALLMSVLPGVAVFRIHSRAGLLVSFTAGMAGALLLSRRLWGKRALALFAFAALAVAAARSEAIWHASAAARPQLALGLALAGLVALAVLRLATAEGDRRRAAVALLCLGAVDLLTAHRAATAAWRWPQPPFREGEAALAAVLRQAPREAGGAPPRALVPFTVARENAALLQRWSSVTGYNALTLGRVWGYLHGRLRVQEPLAENTYVSPEVFAKGAIPYSEASIRVGWDDRSGRLVLRPEIDPRAFLVTRAERVRSSREAVARMADGHDVHAAALVEDGSLLPQGACNETAAPGTADILSFSPELLVVRTRAACPALLVVKEAWYPGWVAHVDGHPAACAPANAWMRAVPLAGGDHVVELRYRSRLLGAGTLVGLLSAGLCAWLWCRRRHPTR